MAKKKPEAQMDLIGPSKEEKAKEKEALNRTMNLVLDCINDAAGLQLQFTSTKIRYLKKIVNDTPDGSKNVEWWSEFFSWVYRAFFQGRSSEFEWGPDVLANRFDKYIDAYMNRERFSVSRYTKEQAARDEWEIVILYSLNGSLSRESLWGETTSSALEAIGGIPRLRSMKVDEVNRVRAEFVREWVSTDRSGASREKVHNSACKTD